MTLNVIKEAFSEGRESPVEWDNSNAKTDHIKLNVLATNIDALKLRSKNTSIPLQQICPTTGEVLRVFPNRMEAARWVAKNVHKLSGDAVQKRAISVSGNLYLSTLAGFKGYGFYWKITDMRGLASFVRAKSEKVNGSPICAFPVGVGSKPLNLVYASISEAARETGVSEKVIRKHLADGSAAVGGYAFRNLKQSESVRTFKDIPTAAAHFGVSERLIASAIVRNVPLNNTIIRLENDAAAAAQRIISASATKYNGARRLKSRTVTTVVQPGLRVQVMQGKRIVGIYTDVKEAATKLGITPKNAASALETGELLGMSKLAFDYVVVE
jgi:hypothetical protein